MTRRANNTSIDPYWSMKRQFERDRGTPNPFGMLAGIFVATGIDGQEYEYEVDLDLHERPGEAEPSALVGPTMDDALKGRTVFQQRRPDKECLWGIQLLCPRCTAPLYVPSTDHPAPKTVARQIVVHWDKPSKSNADGKMRPPVTVVGPIRCDYLQSEMSGIRGPTAMRCGWTGVIDHGKAFDHSVVKGAIKQQGA